MPDIIINGTALPDVCLVGGPVYNTTLCCEKIFSDDCLPVSKLDWIRSSRSNINIVGKT